MSAISSLEHEWLYETNDKFFFATCKQWMQEWDLNLTTSGLWAQQATNCSILQCGSPNRARTCDIMINSHALCQLSYRGIILIYVNIIIYYYNIINLITNCFWQELHLHLQYVNIAVLSCTTVTQEDQSMCTLCISNYRNMMVDCSFYVRTIKKQ